MKNILKRIIKDFHKQVFPEVYERMLAVPFHLNKIISIIGPRRAGKTFYLFQLMMQLEQMGVKRIQLLYINFEDERLEFDGRYDLIIESYTELYPELDLSSSYFFFDEIQELKKWEKYIRRFYDNVSKNIFITGSNSRLLSHEIGTALRGRSLAFEILPLSFREFLLFQHIDTTDIYSIKNASLIQHAFNKYITWGGYPELVYMDERFKLRTLQEYFNVMIYRDLIERYEIKSVHIVKYILKRLISSFTKEFSVNKIFNELKSKGISISKTNLYQLIDQILSIYMLTVIEKYDRSVVKREMSNRKIYLYDTGLTSVTTTSLTEDRGKILENIIFSHLLQMDVQVFFIKNSWECDFVCFHQNSKQSTAIQVTQKLNHINIKRELKGLDAAQKQLNNCNKLILYEEVDPSMSLPDNYEYQSIWAWLLSSW
jgi:hypothetical protein